MLISVILDSEMILLLEHVLLVQRTAENAMKKAVWTIAAFWDSEAMGTADALSALIIARAAMQHLAAKRVMKAFRLIKLTILAINAMRTVFRVLQVDAWLAPPAFTKNLLMEHAL